MGYVEVKLTKGNNQFTSPPNVDTSVSVFDDIRNSGIYNYVEVVYVLSEDGTRWIQVLEDDKWIPNRVYNIKVTQDCTLKISVIDKEQEINWLPFLAIAGSIILAILILRE